jgi:hypothetical protein
MLNLGDGQIRPPSRLPSRGSIRPEGQDILEDEDVVRDTTPDLVMRKDDSIVDAAYMR